ncbi:hypothetical protein IH574_00545, partial [Candidatus Bathyarchaeota archaeon]|nr:hypothetical protein [Candidatus Bathyarchaeota archaeon]
TTLYNKILSKISGSVIGPAIEPYMPYFNITIIILVLFVSFSFWRKGDEVWFGRLFSLNMLMFFPSVLDFSTFNWIGLIFDLKPTPGVTHIWVFGVGLLLQITYLMLSYTVRFRYTREELKGRGANEQDINDVTRGQVSYLVLLTTLTAGLTAGIYIAAPYLTKLAINPIEGLPVPHMLVGFLVVVFIAAALVIYLRTSSE